MCFLPVRVLLGLMPEAFIAKFALPTAAAILPVNPRHTWTDRAVKCGALQTCPPPQPSCPPCPATTTARHYTETSWLLHFILTLDLIPLPLDPFRPPTCSSL